MVVSSQSLLLCCSLGVICYGFQQIQPLSSPRSSRQQNSYTTTNLFVAGIRAKDDEKAKENDDADCSMNSVMGPATVFGQPIHDEAKKRNRAVVRACKSVLFDTLFQGPGVARSYARFYALENIARMPYFSYLSVLHLYESLGWWRRAEYLKVHFSESWNEQHHLLIMEEMGGSQRWLDRFIAQHVAVFYYWIVVALYMQNPTFAYNLNQAVEEEAFETYDNFLKTNSDYLQTQPAPITAIKYYTGDDLYLFDAMHFDAEKRREARRPEMNSLYDAFVAVRDDEAEHAKTMAYLQEDACR